MAHRDGAPLGLTGWICAAAVGIVGCGGGDESAPGESSSVDGASDYAGQEAVGDEAFVDLRVDIPEPPENGLQIVLPEIEIAPGEEKMLCYNTSIPSDRDFWLVRYEGHQGPGGHHLAGMMGSGDAPDGTVADCTTAEQSMAAGPPAFFGVEGGNVWELPDGLGLRLAAGTPIVLQSHYVNSTAKPILTRDIAQLFAAEDPEGLEPASPLVATSLAVEVMPSQKSEMTFDCALEEEVSVYAALGHMHEAGSALTMEIQSDGGTNEIYSVDEWEEEYRDTPPLTTWSLDSPLTISQGDVLRVGCEWESDAGEMLVFPAEMCVGVLFVYPQLDPTACIGTLVGG